MKAKIDHLGYDEAASGFGLELTPESDEEKAAIKNLLRSLDNETGGLALMGGFYGDGPGGQLVATRDNFDYAVIETGPIDVADS